MKKILQLSGGQDSLACLYLAEENLDDILVLWTNPGAPSAELTALMKAVKETVPHFVEVTGNVTEYRKEKGSPDEGTWTACCSSNIWKPMHYACVELGAKVIARGAKRCDPINFIGPGHVEAGIRYEFPLWGWSDKQVQAFLVGRELQPAYPHDCHNCPVTKICDRRVLEAA